MPHLHFATRMFTTILQSCDLYSRHQYKSSESQKGINSQNFVHTEETRYNKIWYNKIPDINQLFFSGPNQINLLCFGNVVLLPDITKSNKISWSQGPCYKEFPLYTYICILAPERFSTSTQLMSFWLWTDNIDTILLNRPIISAGTSPFIRILSEWSNILLNLHWRSKTPGI